MKKPRKSLRETNVVLSWQHFAEKTSEALPERMIQEQQKRVNTNNEDHRAGIASHHREHHMLDNKFYLCDSSRLYLHCERGRLLRYKKLERERLRKQRNRMKNLELEVERLQAEIAQQNAIQEIMSARIERLSRSMQRQANKVRVHALIEPDLSHKGSDTFRFAGYDLPLCSPRVESHTIIVHGDASEPLMLFARRHA